MPAPGVIHSTINRLASRPDGVRNCDLAEAAGLDSKVAGSRLGQRVRSGTLFKVWVKKTGTHFFLTADQAAAFAKRHTIPHERRSTHEVLQDHV